MLPNWEKTIHLLKLAAENRISQDFQRRHYNLVVNSVNDMPDDLRDVLLLYYIDNLKFKEIAETLSMEEWKVLHLHNKGMAQLAAKFVTLGLVAPSAEEPKMKTQAIPVHQPLHHAKYVENPDLVVRCPQCTKKLRIGNVRFDGNYKCPSCDCKFEMTRDKLGKLQILIMNLPQFRNSAGTASTSASLLFDHYKVLGVERNSTWDEIKSAYRNKLQQYHPDKVAQLGPEIKHTAETMTKRLNEAYHALEKKYGIK